MSIKWMAFPFFVTTGIIIAMGIYLLLGNIPLLSETSILGVPLKTVISILIAVPIANLLRRKAFGTRSFGERL